MPYISQNGVVRGPRGPRGPAGAGGVGDGGSVDLTGYSTTTETQGLINTAISQLIGGAPAAALNTIAELAAALGSEQSATATILTQLAGKVGTTTGVKLEWVSTLPANDPAKVGTIYVVRP